MKRTKAQRGTQLLELVIVLPLLVFLALVIGEGAAFVRVHQVLNNAAREGARMASLKENYCNTNKCTAAMRQAVISYAALNGVTLKDAEITINQDILIPLPSGIYTRATRVTVSHPYNLTYLPKLPYFTVPTVVTLSGAAEFKNTD